MSAKDHQSWGGELHPEPPPARRPKRIKDEEW